MGPQEHHLAQLNIGKLLKPTDHPQIQEFMDNLDKINALAESIQGFVWRLKDETGNATGISVFDDPLIIVNMSVWESVESLQKFVYNSNHLTFLKKRRQWFEKPNGPHMVLWWIPKDHLPTLDEAKSKLNYLTEHGETEEAFTFKSIFPHR